MSDVTAHWICDTMMGYEDVIGATHNDSETAVSILSADNDAVIESLYQILEPLTDYREFPLSDESRSDDVTRWIREEPETTVVIVNNQLGEGPHTDWPYGPDVIFPDRMNPVVIVSQDGGMGQVE